MRDVREIGLVLASLGLVSSFFGPAQSAALRTLDSPQDLLAANAMLSQAFHAVRILSPAVAGALIRGFGHSFTWTENLRVGGSIPPLGTNSLMSSEDHISPSWLRT